MRKKSHSPIPGIGAVPDNGPSFGGTDIRIRTASGALQENQGRMLPRSMMEGSETERLHALMFLSQRDNEGMMPLSNIIRGDLELLKRSDNTRGAPKISDDEKRIVIGALDSADPLMRSIGAAMISNLEPHALGKKDIPRLVGALLDPNLDVRGGVQNALASYSSTDPKSLIKAIDSFKRSDKRLIDHDASIRLDVLRMEADSRK